MEYHQYFAAQQPQAFNPYLTFPPAQAQSDSVHPEEQPFPNDSSVDFPNATYPPFGTVNGHFNPSQAPPQPPHQEQQAQQSQTNGFIPQQEQREKSPEIKRQGSSSGQIPMTNGTQDESTMLNGDHDQNSRSSSEEKENLTPAQSRRKAQNRAAQRAFRERKERHVKDLEVKLSTLEENSSSLVGENERLKQDLQKIATENEILRATSARFAPGGDGGDIGWGAVNGSAGNSVTGPMRYSPNDFYSDVLSPHDNKTVSHRITVSDSTGARLLAAGAAWDFIQEQPPVKDGLVDIGDVCERIRDLAKCDGQGPVFDEIDIKKAIEASAISGKDELI